MRFALMKVGLLNKTRRIPTRRRPPNRKTLEFLATTQCRDIAEIGVGWGATSMEIARWLNHEGALHLFDYSSRAETVRDDLHAAGYRNVVAHGNTHRTLDSYNWSLMRLLQSTARPIFDYVYLDGAHTWGTDGLAFLLLDRLLRPGGYIDFDDYNWTHADSPTANPAKWPKVRELLTDEQITTPQVKLIVELLVRRDPRFEEVVPNKIFRKSLTTV
jgi:predicted O-methyltransferase YrrM